MSTKYTVRVASPVAYEYWEATSDTFEELLSAEQELREAKAEAGGSGSVAQATETVKKAFGKTTEVGSGSATTGGGFGNKGRQEAEPEERKLGEHEGYTLTIRKGKFGPYFNAYNYETKDRLPNANAPKGMKVSEATLQDAIDALSAA